MEALILEHLDRHRRVKTRVRVDQLPFAIGRGYDSDYIVDDDFVSPNHIVIERDDQGQVVLIDRGSTNGLYDLSRGKAKVDRLVALPDAQFRIGHSYFRLRSDQFEARPTKVDRLTNLALNRLIDSRIAMFGLVLVSLLAFFVRTYLPDYSERSAGKIFFDEVIPIYVVIFLWAGVWAIVSYINSHRSYFAVHVAIASVAMVVGGFMVLAEDFARFGFAVDAFSGVTSYGIVAVTTFILLYGHLRLVSSRSPKRIAQQAVAACLLFNGMFIAGDYFRQEDFTQAPQFNSGLYSPSFQWSDGVSLDQWVDDAQKLVVPVQSEVNKMRTKGD